MKEQLTPEIRSKLERKCWIPDVGTRQFETLMQAFKMGFEYASQSPLSSAPMVEFCYKSGDKVEVRWRCEEGTEDGEKLKAEVNLLQLRWGSNCPYYWRIAF